MATRKQKHAAGLARREAFLAEERERGQKAIARARKQREAEARKKWEGEHEKHYKFDNDCPLCTTIKNQQAAGKVASAKGKPPRKSIDSLLAESPSVESQAEVEKATVSV